MTKVWVVFLMRTDTTKDTPGKFVGVYDSEQEAMRWTDAENRETEDSRGNTFYAVRGVEMNNPREGYRLWVEGSGY